MKNKSTLKQKRKLEKRSIFRRFSGKYKSERGFRYPKLDDFELTNKDNTVKDGTTPFYWAEFEGYGVKDSGTQSNNGEVFKQCRLVEKCFANFHGGPELVQRNNKHDWAAERKRSARQLETNQEAFGLPRPQLRWELDFLSQQKVFRRKIKDKRFFELVQNYKGCNSFLDCASFLRNEIAEWFKEGRKRYDVTVIFKEKKELCGKNIKTIMDFSKLICKRNVCFKYFNDRFFFFFLWKYQNVKRQ